MNDEIIEKAEELKRAIMQSDEYQKFTKYREALAKDEVLYNVTTKFREKNFKYQLTGTMDANKDAQSLLEEYEDVLMHPVVYEYMNAELVFCKKMQQVYDLLNQDLELDIDFL